MKYHLELVLDSCCASRAAAIALGEQLTAQLRHVRFTTRPLAGPSWTGSGERIWCSPTWVLDRHIVWVGLPTFKQLAAAIRQAIQQK
jgi:hypothetical protein